jgi:hypothetical protein
MIPIDHLWRSIFLLLLAVTLSLTSPASTNPRIIPLQTSVIFSAQSAQNRWSVPIKSAGGRTIYILSLEPDWWFGSPRRVEGVDLVLRHPRDKAGTENLFDPTGNWHGLQNFMFPARDFKDGMKNSLYGEKRTIIIKRLGLVLRVTILKAGVSPISTKDYQLDNLELQINVDNLPSVP